MNVQKQEYNETTLLYLQNCLSSIAQSKFEVIERFGSCLKKNIGAYLTNGNIDIVERVQILKEEEIPKKIILESLDNLIIKINSPEEVALMKLYSGSYQPECSLYFDTTKKEFLLIVENPGEIETKNIKVLENGEEFRIRFKGNKEKFCNPDWEVLAQHQMTGPYEVFTNYSKKSNYRPGELVGEPILENGILIVK